MKANWSAALRTLEVTTTSMLLSNASLESLLCWVHNESLWNLALFCTPLPLEPQSKGTRPEGQLAINWLWMSTQEMKSGIFWIPNEKQDKSNF